MREVRQTAAGSASPATRRRGFASAEVRRRAAWERVRPGVAPHTAAAAAEEGGHIAAAGGGVAEEEAHNVAAAAGVVEAEADMKVSTFPAVEWELGRPGEAGGS